MTLPTGNDQLNNQPDDSRNISLSNRRVIVAVTGGIACYKTAAIVSRLTQSGCEVRVLMTEAASQFITPLTLQTLSGNPVRSSIWQTDEHPDVKHIGLARWCDIMIIAPASANIIAKIAHGLADDIVSLVALALPQATPRLIAPAMNAQMWHNPVTQQNITTLKNLLGCHLVGPEEGWQACRSSGMGRMSEPETIYNTAVELLTK